MRILAIGDFHGVFPNKLKKIAKNVDLILSPGDFANGDKIRKIIFNNWAGKKWYKVVGLRKARQIENESYDSGLKILKELNDLGKPVYFVWGNLDFYKNCDSNEPKEIMPGYYESAIKNFYNLKLLNKRKALFNEIEFVGHGGYVDATDFIITPIDKDRKKIKKRLKRYNKTKTKLFNIFKEKPGKNFILLTHYTPYGIFDKVNNKKSPMNGKHVGFEPYNEVINNYNPRLVICGHMHENQGVKKLGKSIIVNTGAAKDGKAALIEINDRLKIKLIN